MSEISLLKMVADGTLRLVPGNFMTSQNPALVPPPPAHLQQFLTASIAPTTAQPVTNFDMQRARNIPSLLDMDVRPPVKTRLTFPQQARSAKLRLGTSQGRRQRSTRRKEKHQTRPTKENNKILNNIPQEEPEADLEMYEVTTDVGDETELWIPNACSTSTDSGAEEPAEKRATMSKSVANRFALATNWKKNFIKWVLFTNTRGRDQEMKRLLVEARKLFKQQE